MRFEKIKAGTTLIDEHREKMGNTTMSRLGEWPVCIVSIDLEKRTAVVRWNHNREQVYSARRLEKLRPFLSAAYMRQHESSTRGDDPYGNAAHYPRRAKKPVPA